MPYAEGTKVSVKSSQDDIRSVLAKHGCKQFGLYDDEHRSSVQFVMSGLPYRFTVERPTKTEVSEQLARQGRTLRRVQDWPGKIEQEWRRRWRARLLWLKATLEFAEDDEDFIAQALMSQLVLPDQSTLGQWAAERLPEIYSSGRLPALPMFSEEAR